MRQLLTAMTITYLLFAGTALADGSCITAEKVCRLKAGFNPQTGSSPICDRTQQKSRAKGRAGARTFANTFVKPFQDAVALAPDKAYADFCAVDKYFIVSANAPWSSWGLWENPSNAAYAKSPGKNNSYIAVSEDIFKLNVSALEQKLQNSIVKGSAINYTANSKSADLQTLALLSAMAHEMGHIQWHKYRDSNDKAFRELKCFEDTFLAFSWDKSRSQGALQRPWTPYNDKGRSAHKGNVPHPGDGQPMNPSDVRKVHEGGFISAFAAVSPEEDFVETYKVLILDESLSEYKVRVAGGLFDILDKIRNDPGSTISQKAKCVRPVAYN